MSCEGDKVAGFDTREKCYNEEACYGCKKCIIKCTGCDNCEEFEKNYKTLSKPEIGDYVVVHQKLIIDPNFKGTWSPAMDMAIGRVGWVKSGNPVDGFTVRFTTTNSEMLAKFVFPQSSLKKAVIKDQDTDKMIRQVAKGNANQDI